MDVELPTLRIETLRRLVRQVRRVSPVVVVHESTPVKSIAALLHASPSSTAIVVDRRGVLVGTLRLDDLVGADPDDAADQVMVEAPVLEAEHDLEAARLAMYTHGCDRVVVVEPDGRLLGVLTEAELARKSDARLS